MVSFCLYVRIFDKLYFCIIGICDIVVLFDIEVCDGRFKLFFCIIVIVFDVEGNGIVIFFVVLSFWLFELMVVDIVEIVVVCEVLLIGVCDDS